MKRQMVTVDAAGNCVVTGGFAGRAVPVARRVKVVKPLVSVCAPKRSKEDVAPWMMRVLAGALVLFVLVLLALHG